MTRLPIIAAAVAAALLATPALADEISDAVAACDVLTASGADPDRRAEPVGFNQIDTAAAIEACAKAVELAPEDGKLYFQLGRAYERAGDEEKAWDLYLQGSELGSPIAMRQLGGLAYFGWDGHPPDFDVAFKWYQAASDAGMALASRELGMNLMGETYPPEKRDYPRALKSLLIAIDQGATDVSRWIGQVYHRAGPDLRDYAKAEEWYLKSAVDEKNANGMDALGTFYGFAEGREPLWDKCVLWYGRAVEGGSALAAFNLGQMYYYAVGVDKDIAKAVELLGIGAQRGNLRSMDLLGHAYNEGIEVAFDGELAAQYLYQAVIFGFRSTFDSLIEYDYEPATVAALERLLADDGFLDSSKVDEIWDDDSETALSAAFRSAV